MLCLSVLLLGLARDRPAVVAATASLAILCRPHLGLAALAAATFMLVQTRRRAWTLGVVGLAVGTALLLAYNAAVYGHLTVLGGYDASHLRPFGVGLTKLPENIAGALVSPSRGVFVYSPIVPVLLPFAVDAWRHAETWVKAAAIGGLVYLVVQLYLLRFTGGNRFYSFRVPLETLLLCWPLLALAFEGGLRAGHRLLLTAAAGVSCAITGVGAVTNFISTTEIRPWHQFDLVEASRSLTVQGGLLACVVVTGVSIAVFRAESGEEGRRLADVSPPTPGERLVER
jgi:alpha-1,2-mannosyltransferase